MLLEIVLTTHLLITRPVFEEQRRRTDDSELSGAIAMERVCREYENIFPHIEPLQESPFQLEESRSVASDSIQGSWALMENAGMENAGLKILLTDLATLLQSQDYNDEFIRPTRHALTRTWNILRDASVFTTGPFPVGTIFPDGDGGLRIEWIRPSRELRLAVSAQPDGKAYIYHELGDRYDVDYRVTPNILAFWLNWLNEGRATIDTATDSAVLHSTVERMVLFSSVAQARRQLYGLSGSAQQQPQG